ncbi:amidohydrolase [Amycolatopsis sp. FDAARGOS 1241]|uniref:amidohydrolase n=1 Tax=Amycolatopsis sp. FDAARGOS 1241 TaxID=2778070 RepID=UPI0019517E89|nr:amidohydrolase [Amycolatopsis sp. FDAARGOS 1241]QRP47765.1 amidohydrolase [Amycolatopsis sp. FDAARGOS 1241]
MIMTSTYVNGHFLTLDSETPVASAVAIRAGRFTAVGDDATVLTHAGPDAEVVDLGGATVIPGFNDSHCHIEFAGQAGLVVDLAGVGTVAEALAVIRDFVAGQPAGEWVTGSGWHPPSQLAEARYLTRAELDEAAPRNPVFLPTVGHVAMTNSAGLERAGIDENTPDPSGGTIERDSAGRATGVLYEHAIDLVTAVKPGWTTEELEQQFAAGLARANSFGITSVLQPYLHSRGIRALQRLWQDGRLTARVGVLWAPDPSVSLDEWRRTVEATGVSSWFGDEWLKLAGIKLISDGGMTLRTALMRGAYPGDGHDHGMATMSAEHLTDLVVAAHERDWRLGVHCVGDLAVDRVLDAFEAADRVRPIAGRRFALIHGSLGRREQFERARALGVRLELQPVFLWGKAATIEKGLGTETTNRAIPMRTAIDVFGIDAVSMGTDFPANELNPFSGLQLAVTRRDARGVAYGPEEAVTREEALRSYTASGAFATRDETVKGTISPGKLADFAVLSDDYLGVDADHIKDLEVVRTVVGGRVVFER